MTNPMGNEVGMIGPVQVQRDADGWWQHPALPSFGEDLEAYRSWLQDHGLQHSQWSMESDGPEDHPYWLGDGGATHCRGWEPRSPGPEWFLLGIFDTENGPYVSWVRRLAENSHERSSESVVGASSQTTGVGPAAPLMHRYATGNLKHVFPWVSEQACNIRVLVHVEGEMIAAAQVQRNEGEDSFQCATREEMKHLQQFYELNRGIYWRPAELGLTACPEDDLPSWVID